MERGIHLNRKRDVYVKRFAAESNFFVNYQSLSSNV